MKVSAIVPTYNEELSIGPCLTSLLQQRGVDDYEILVIDGRSTDQTMTSSAVSRNLVGRLSS